MTDSVSLADIAAVTKDHDGDFGGSGWWIIILFFAIMMNNGGWGNNNGFANAIGYENLATSNEVQRGFDNQNSMANQREILAAVNQNFHDTAQFVGDKYSEIQRDLAAIQVGQANALANQNQCCCDTRMEIQQGNNAIIQAIQSEGNATRSMIQQDKIEGLQAQVQQLQLEQQMAGVVRYPMGFNYNAGPSPFCGCGCGGNI